MVAVATPEVDAGMWLSATHFAVGSTRSWPSVQPDSQQPAQLKGLRNKTIGLEMLEGAAADGD
jgi:hypothetical protein